MSVDKPYHVRVAEAVGWTDCRNTNSMNPLAWYGWHAPMMVGQREQVPDFPHDWSATGPLTEKYKISLYYDLISKEWWAILGADDLLQGGIGGEAEAAGGTSLEAVCNLLLALKEAGKL